MQYGQYRSIASSSRLTSSQSSIASFCPKLPPVGARLPDVTTSSDVGTTWVLRLDVVRWGIQQLALRRAHPFFVAYLHLRRRASVEGSDTEIRPHWNQLGEYLEVPGGPPKKPYYRPLFDPPGNPSRYWLNENLAGSFSPSSLREGQPAIQVVQKESQGRFSLRPNHSQLALQHLLYGDPLDIYPLIAFLYRDFGVITDPGDSSPPPRDSLLEVFRQDWRFSDSNRDATDFNALFETDTIAFTLALQPEDWFELF